MCCTCTEEVFRIKLLSAATHKPVLYIIRSAIKFYKKNFSKFWKIFWSFCRASKMTPTDEFWVRRRTLEPRYRNIWILPIESSDPSCISWNWFSSSLTMSAVYWWPGNLLINVFRLILSYYNVFSGKNTVLNFWDGPFRVLLTWVNVTVKKEEFDDPETKLGTKLIILGGRSTVDPITGGTQFLTIS